MHLDCLVDITLTCGIKMANIALITGRGGSSFKDKNIREVCGIPAVKYPGIAAISSGIFDQKFCSSDSDNILNTCIELDYEPIKRPDNISTATSLHIEAIDHAIKEITLRGIDIDFLYVFLANNVCTTPEMIKQSWDILQSDNTITSVVPAYREYNHHPLRAMKLNESKDLESFVQGIDQKTSSNRQDLKPSYFLCHNFWAIAVKRQKDGWTGNAPWPFLGNKVKLLEVEQLTDIHNEEDLKKSEEWVRRTNE